MILFSFTKSQDFYQNEIDAGVQLAMISTSMMGLDNLLAINIKLAILINGRPFR